MTPEAILRKYIGNMHYKNEAEIVKAMQEYASLHDQEVAAAAWEASEAYNTFQPAFPGWSPDDPQPEPPNKEEYLKSLTTKNKQ